MFIPSKKNPINNWILWGGKQFPISFNRRFHCSFQHINTTKTRLIELIPRTIWLLWSRMAFSKSEFLNSNILLLFYIITWDKHDRVRRIYWKISHRWLCSLWFEDFFCMVLNFSPKKLEKKNPSEKNSISKFHFDLSL